MRFTFLTPGTGHFFCGSCLRDHSMGKALLQRGHDVAIVPLYLPHVVEDDEGLRPGEPGGAGQDEVRMGGINMYLQQKSRLLARLPGWLRRWLDRPGLLRWASRQGSMTDASRLGAMTLSMLEGEEGRQVAELEQLVASLREAGGHEVVVLSNAMLIGAVRRLKQELGVPVVVTLQGEQPFLDSLPEPFRSRAWQTLRERAREVDLFVPVSATYGRVMGERLGIEAGRLHTIHNGIDLAGFEAQPRPLAERGPVVGYLARMCTDKGLPTLVEAFVELCRRGRVPDARLRVVGVQLAEDRRLVRRMQARLAEAGLADRATFHANVTKAEKLEHLRAMRVLSVPALYGESFGLYLLEALASGVPFVQPDHGAFAEIGTATGGGSIVRPDDAGHLADELERLLTDVDAAQALADAGLDAVRARFHSTSMAEAFERVCAERFARTRSTRPGPPASYAGSVPRD